MRRIIIIGASHHNTLSVVRCIGEVFGQIELVIIGHSESYVSKSKYVVKTTYLGDSDALYSWAINNKSADTPIIISCADIVSQTFDMHYDELHNYYDFFNAGACGILTAFMNKQLQVDLAKEVGFVTPISAYYSNKDKVDDFTSFPCIVKPLQSYIGGKNIWYCNNSDELQEIVTSAPDGIMLQAQEQINNHYEIVLPGLITKEEIFVPGYILKHRDFLGGTTYSSVKQHNVQTNKLVIYSASMLHKISYEGLFGIEAMFNGKDYVFIELNLRNDATCYSMAVAGANLPAMYVNYILGKKLEFKQISEITSMVENKDFSHVIRKNIGIWHWLKELRESQCKFLYNKYDKKPFFACIIEQITNKIHL